MIKNNPALNSHKRNTAKANGDTHFVVIDTWGFDTLEHAFETKEKANAQRDLWNLQHNVLHRYTVRERAGKF